MENNDFRSRLRGQRTDYNPDAWKQMSEMLDALPVVEEKRKKGWWLFLLLFIGFSVMIGSYLMINRNSQAVILTEDDKGIFPSEHKTNKGEIQRMDSQKIATVDSSSSVGEELHEQEVNSVSSDPLTEIESVVKKDNNVLTNVNIDSRVTQTQIIENGFNKNRSVANSKIAASDNLATESKLSEMVDSDSQLLTAREKAQESVIEMRLALDELSELFSYPVSHYFQLRSLAEETRALPSLGYEKLLVLKNKKLYWFGGLGLSDINGTRGVYLGTGLMIDLDKVAAFESDIYIINAYGERLSDESTLIGTDLEISLNVWLHLNLIRKGNHKLSAEIGPSVDYIWGAEKSLSGVGTILPESRIDWNFRGGISYTNFVTEKTAIGIKGSFSLYDSGYLACKFYRKIR